MLSDLLNQAANEAAFLEQRILDLEIQQEKTKAKRKKDKEQLTNVLSNLLYYLNEDD